MTGRQVFGTAVVCALAFCLSGAFREVHAARAASVVIAVTDVTGTRSVPGDEYTAGGQVTVSVHVEHAGDLTALGVVENPPAGWTLSSVGGDDPPAIQPPGGSSGSLAFAWISVPASPVDFTYMLNVPADATGQKTISGAVFYRKGAGELQAQIPETVLTPTGSPNRPPVADAGPDRTVGVGEVVLLDAGGSQDPDGVIVLYEWDCDGDGNYEVTGDTVVYTWQSPGQYTVTLRVTDDDGATDTDTCVITVLPAVTYPTATGVTWKAGSSYTITWSGYVGANVKVELYKGGALNRKMTSSTANDGSYAWTAPSGQALGSDYKIKITSTSSTAQYDYSDNYFTIAVP